MCVCERESVSACPDLGRNNPHNPPSTLHGLVNLLSRTSALASPQVDALTEEDLVDEPWLLDVARALGRPPPPPTTKTPTPSCSRALGFDPAPSSGYHAPTQGPVVLARPCEARGTQPVWLVRSEAAARGPRRQLQDTFGDSLRFVNALFTAAWGHEARKAPAHMPHFIDKHVMAELQALYPTQYDATSTHRFRHSQDMQFSFAYFYYLMGAPAPYNAQQVGIAFARIAPCSLRLIVIVIVIQSCVRCSPSSWTRTATGCWALAR